VSLAALASFALSFCTLTPLSSLSRGSLFSAWNKERVGEEERESEGEDVLQYRDRAQ